MTWVLQGLLEVPSGRAPHPTGGSRQSSQLFPGAVVQGAELLQTQGRSLPRTLKQEDSRMFGGSRAGGPAAACPHTRPQHSHSLPWAGKTFGFGQPSISQGALHPVSGDPAAAALPPQPSRAPLPTSSLCGRHLETSQTRLRKTGWT